MDGPLSAGFDPTNDYSVTPVGGADRSSVAATLIDRKWLGTHTLIVRGTNGMEDSSADARGDSGLFASVDSVPLLITITDPCIDSTVNSLNKFEIDEVFRVPLGSFKKDLANEGPSDSVSLTYGNGYDICGPLNYDFTDATNG